MKIHNQIVSVIALCLLVFQSVGQNALNVTQIGHLPYTESLSEVRGAEHNGREYALVGVNNGFSIVDVEDPANPTQVFFEPGPNSIWRDPFYHNGYAYCVTEGGGGLLIVDMGPLPASTNLTTALYTGSNIQWSTAHNMFIDVDNDKAYIFGTDNIQGAIILDISDPMNPAELGVWNDHYIHDGFVRGDTLWASCLEAGTFVVDVSTPSNPVVLTSWDTPSEFGHNVWPSDDNAFCYTTDEVESGFVAAYDMSDYQNIVESDKVNHPLSENVIPHNTHFINDYVVTSHYRDGLTIHDVSDPFNIVLTGYFDSSPLSGGGFNGAWGAWPYLPSGNLLIADIEEGLFIVGATYKRAARLEGVVSEFGTGTFLNDVLVEITAVNLEESTNLFGEYATGAEAAGTYEVTFQKGGYLPQTITGVELVNGQTTTLNVELVPETPFTFGGSVTVEGSTDPIDGATIQFTSNFFDLEYDSDANGDYTDTVFFAGQYDVVVSAWGYVTECTSVDVTEAGNLNFELEQGYYDDFATDLGWTVTGSAPVGVWEHGVPVGTDFNGTPSNPGTDAGSACGDQAYITGNGGGGAGNDDVDDGVTILRSPIMDLTNTSSPIIDFSYWFFNAGGSSTPNDKCVVKLSDGSNTVTVAELQQSGGSWLQYGFGVEDLLASTDQMQLIVEVEDSDPGHLVEAGIDNFRVLEGFGINDNSNAQRVSIYPNPSNGSLNIAVPVGINSCKLNLFDSTGRLIHQESNLIVGLNSINLEQKPGVYICEFIVGEVRQVERLLIQ